MPKYNTALMSIDIKETRRYAGLNKAPDFNKKTVKEACREILYVAEPRGKKVTQHLCRAQKVIIMAVTIGEAVEEEIARRFKDGEYTLAVLMDAAATTAVEQVADGIEKAVDQKFAVQGFVRRWRFSPGYGDWPIECQTRMLELSQADKIGMGVTSSLMLTPRKSVTAIIGLVPKMDDVAAEKQSCKFCPKPDCNFRTRPFEPLVNDEILDEGK